MFELVDNVQQNAVIKVVGVGGGGGNAVRHMLNSDIEGVEFICANTDAQALTDMDARQIIQLGGNITKGLGAGANPEVGRQSALEDRDRIAEAIKGADMGLEERVKFAGQKRNEVLESEDAKEGVLAFAEKRAPVWKGR